MTLPAVGAWVCASGSQVWKGTAGSFTRKAARNPGSKKESDRRSYGRMEQGLVVEGVDARGAAVCKVEADNGREHEKAAELCEEEEFDGSPEAVFMAPAIDEKIHGHEHELPGKIEEEEVEAEEYAEHARNGPGEAQVKKARSLRDLVPGCGGRHAAEEGGQTDKDQARPIHGQMEADAGKEEPRGRCRSEPWAVGSRLMQEAEP